MKMRKKDQEKAVKEESQPKTIDQKVTSDSQAYVESLPARSFNSYWFHFGSQKEAYNTLRT
jgi:hypothetical protein